MTVPKTQPCRHALNRHQLSIGQEKCDEFEPGNSNWPLVTLMTAA